MCPRRRSLSCPRGAAGNRPRPAPAPVGCRSGSCRPAAMTGLLPRRSAGHACAWEVPLTVVAKVAMTDRLLEIEAETATGAGRSSHARGA